MFKLQSKQNEEKHAILLNHRQLINKAYSDAVGDEETYELKSQLFQFEPKKRTAEPRKKLKRKWNDGTTNTVQKTINEQQKNYDTVDDNIDEYLKLLPTPQFWSDTKTLPRYWEAEYKLPQLHGTNESGKFQKFQSFLIPQAARFYNHNVEHLTMLLPQLLPRYDLITIDPPWRNKYIRRLKRVKQELGYAMLDNDQLAMLPLSQLTHERTLVAIWCTNSMLHQQALETQLLSRWKLRLLHKLRWYKLNTSHQLISNLQCGDATQKQPYELLYLACHANSAVTYAANLKHTELILSVPSIIHSHKPPLYSWLKQHLQLDAAQVEPNCLELFARYLQPQFTSIGLEVLRLMDERLYDKILKQS